jgi:hypothetical protein
MSPMRKTETTVVLTVAGGMIRAWAALAEPINVVATARSTTPFFVTTTHELVNNGTDVQITVFALGRQRSCGAQRYVRLALSSGFLPSSPLTSVKSSGNSCTNTRAVAPPIQCVRAEERTEYCVRFGSSGGTIRPNYSCYQD